MRYLLLILWSCQVGESPRATAPDDTGAGDLCALQMQEEHWTPTWTNTRFEVEGGSGDLVFTLTASPSGGIVDPETGAYLSGGVPEVTDELRVDDLTCDRQAEAHIYVSTPLEVLPEAAVVQPDTVLPLEISGGSGEVSCVLELSQSGGVMEDCVYRAGESEGEDQLVITDTRTDESIQILVEVLADASLELPTLLWAIAPGQPLSFPFTGGTGIVDLELVSGEASFEDDQVTLTDQQTAVILARDRFTGYELELEIDPLQHRSPSDLSASGSDPDSGHVLAVGDLDSNGFDDAVVTDPDGSAETLEGGVARVFLSDGEGLIESQAIAGDEVGAWLGDSAAVGDFDGDGRLDLAMGAPFGTGYELGSGRVQVHAGIDGGFEQAPTVEIYGAYEEAHLGESLVACDFNGDGYDDLAIGAPDAVIAKDLKEEDSTDTGGVAIHLGSGLGLSSAEDLWIWGEVLDGGVWQVADALNFGGSLGAGDLDGDGHCELIVGSPDAKLTPGGDSINGLVHVFGGSTDGITTPASALWTLDEDLNSEHASGLGNAISTGDVDGDGLLELAIGANEAQDASGQGRVVIADTRGLIPGEEALALETVPERWRVHSSESWSQLGSAVELADLDGDGLDDLVVGAPGENRVHAYLASLMLSEWDTGFDAQDEEPSSILLHSVPGAAYGRSVRLLGDLDGDGAEDLGVLASQDSSFGIALGALYTLPWNGTGPGSLLNIGDEISGQDIGTRGSIAFADIDADGHDELVLGGSGEGLGLGPDYGAAWVYDIDSLGALSDDPLVRLGPLEFQEPSDRLGAQVRSAGDVDGDGDDEVVLLASGSQIPATMPLDFEGTECLEGQDGRGAALVFEGSPDGLAESPSWAAWQTHTNQSGGSSVVAGLDLNGDGTRELGIGGDGHISIGFELDPGSEAADAQVVCGDEFEVTGEFSLLFGMQMVDLGDLDGDGCDELAVSAPGFDGGPDGRVRIFWGAGAEDCPDSMEQLVITREGSDGTLGEVMVAGVDLDGDSVGDLVIGEPGYLLNEERMGRLWWISGAELTDLERSPATASLPDDELLGTYDLSELAAGGQVGDQVDAGFAESIALVSHALGTWLVVGSPGALGGVGTVTIHALQDDELIPLITLVGQTAESPGAFGSALAVGELDGEPVLAIGAELGNGVGIANGLVFFSDLSHRVGW